MAKKNMGTFQEPIITVNEESQYVNEELETATKRSEAYEYAWMATSPRHPQHFRRMERKGWQLVDANAEPDVAPNAVVQDGRFVLDDVVLMKMDKELYLKQQKKSEEDYLSLLKATEEDMREQMLRNAGDDVTLRFIDEGKEIETTATRSSFYIPNNPLAKS